MTTLPCPFCGWPDGFHNDFPGSPHLSHVVPAHLVRKSNSQLRRERATRSSPDRIESTGNELKKE